MSTYELIVSTVDGGYDTNHEYNHRYFDEFTDALVEAQECEAKYPNNTVDIFNWFTGRYVD